MPDRVYQVVITYTAPISIVAGSKGSATRQAKRAIAMGILTLDDFEMKVEVADG